jgi:hypothetical protein
MRCYVAVLRRMQPRTEREQFTATTLEGVPGDVSEAKYEEILKRETGPWFTGDGAYHRALMFGHLLTDEARVAGYAGVGIVDLFRVVPDRAAA